MDVNPNLLPGYAPFAKFETDFLQTRWMNRLAKLSQQKSMNKKSVSLDTMICVPIQCIVSPPPKLYFLLWKSFKN